MKHLFVLIFLLSQTAILKAQYVTLKGMTCVVFNQAAVEVHLHPKHSVQMNFRYIKTPERLDTKYFVKAWMPEYRYYFYKIKDRKHNFFTSAYARFAHVLDTEAGSNSIQGYATSRENGGGVMFGYRKKEDKLIFEVFGGFHRVKGEYYSNYRRFTSHYQGARPRFGILFGYLI